MNSVGSKSRSMVFEYVQVFTKAHRGIFNAGDRVSNQISFPTLSHFTRWVQEINQAHKARKLPYYIIVE